MSNKQKLNKEYVELSKKSKELVNKADITEEENNDLNATMDQMDAIKAKIDQIERHEAHEASLNEVVKSRSGRENIGFNEAQDKTQNEVEVFNKFLRFGVNGMADSDKSLFIKQQSELKKVFGAQSVGTGSEGGFTVPEGFRAILEEAMKDFSGIREAGATVLSTASGNDIPMPSADDTGNAGRLIGENTKVSEQDITFSVKTLGAYKYSSDLIRVPTELIQDSGINMSEYIGRALGERLGRITTAHFTNGTGVNQPEGVVTAAQTGKLAALNNAISEDELYDLIHSVDPAYRRRGAKFMFNDSTLKAIKQLTDSEGRRLWQPGLSASDPSTINGYGYVINPHMDNVVASGKPIIFGDFSKFYIRDVQGTVMRRLAERYADDDQVGFMAFSRHDSILQDAGAGAVKVLQLPA